MKRIHKIEFEPTKDLKNLVGEGIEKGQYVELMTTFQVKDNGNWCIVSWEGVPAPGYNDDDVKDDDYRDKGNFSASYMQNMGA